MARKSKGLDQKLIKTGLQLIKKRGASDVPLREVAQKANVNLGMFNYFFKNKEDFITKVLNELYEPFISDLKMPEINNQIPELQLVLFKMAKFSQKNRNLILIILKDILANDNSTIKYSKKNFTQHFLILRSSLENFLIKRQIKNYDLNYLLRFTVASLGLPNLLLEIQTTIFKVNDHLEESDDQIKTRVKVIIESIVSLSHQTSALRD